MRVMQEKLAKTNHSSAPQRETQILPASTESIGAHFPPTPYPSPTVEPSSDTLSPPVDALNELLLYPQQLVALSSATNL